MIGQQTGRGADVHTIRPAVPDLREIVARVGGELSAGGRQALVPGPGHSKRDRSLSLRVSDDGTRVLFHSFASDSVRDIFAHLGIDTAREYKPSRSEVEANRRRREDEARKLEAEKLAFCGSVWADTQPLPDTAGAAYLWSRGLVLDCPDVRYHPAAPRAVPWNRHPDDPPPPEPAPAVVCLSRGAGGVPQGLHLTFVTPDGRKAFGDRSRLMIGPFTGTALRLAPIRADGVLGVGEGLETCGAFALLKDVPTWPTWSTAGLRKFEPPLSVRRLLIAADNDQNGAGMIAAQELAERASRRCDVEILMPASAGDDWSDVLMGGDGHE